MPLAPPLPSDIITGTNPYATTTSPNLISKSAFIGKSLNSNSLCSIELPPEATNLIRDPIWIPITGHNIGPYVKVWFIGANFCVTVGNQSLPGGSDCQGGAIGSKGGFCSGATIEEYAKNHAVIKSFQYGLSAGGSGGFGVKVEIADEQGSEFCDFMLNIWPNRQNKPDIGSNAIMAFEFGWITENCNGEICNVLSRKRKSLPQTVDVTFGNGGIVKFSITGNCYSEVLIEGVNNETSEYKMPLKDAIVAVLKPYKIEPKFLSSVTLNPCGSDSCFDALTGCKGNPIVDPEPTSYPIWKFFLNEGCGGKPPGDEVYPTNNKDPITAISEWLFTKATKNNPPRGFIVGHCNLVKAKPMVIFWEAPHPDCKGVCDNPKNLGTFIVNGGKCSSVISFTPKIQLGMTNKNFGGGIPETTAKATLSTHNCKTDGTGTAHRNIVSGPTASQYAATGGEVISEAAAANIRAHMPDQISAIEAELLIQGNPVFDEPMMAGAALFASVIVINPFMLRPKKGSSCADWLADPPMNTFLSNKSWSVNGIHHEIKEGSFTTTLKLQLALPGVDINRGAPLGGPPGPIMSDNGAVG